MGPRRTHADAEKRPREARSRDWSDAATRRSTLAAQKLEEAGGTLPWSLRRSSPADTLIWGFQPPELGESISVVFSPPGLQSFCHSSPRTLIHMSRSQLSHLFRSERHPPKMSNKPQSLSQETGCPTAAGSPGGTGGKAAGQGRAVKVQYGVGFEPSWEWEGTGLMRSPQVKLGGVKLEMHGKRREGGRKETVGGNSAHQYP